MRSPECVRRPWAPGAGMKTVNFIVLVVNEMDIKSSMCPCACDRGRPPKRGIQRSKHLRIWIFSCVIMVKYTQPNGESGNLARRKLTLHPRIVILQPTAPAARNETRICNRNTPSNVTAGEHEGQTGRPGVTLRQFYTMQHRRRRYNPTVSNGSVSSAWESENGDNDKDDESTLLQLSLSANRGVDVQEDGENAGTVRPTVVRSHHSR